MDGNIRALITQSDLNLEQAMQLINTHHARTPLQPGQVYIFGMTLSGQALETYLTRMGRSTLNNFARDFADGRPLMNSHRTGRFNAELPIGRIFASRLTGDFLPDNASFEASGGATLDVYSYIQRGLRITDVSTDDLVTAIDGGTIRDDSVGFSLSPDGMYQCSICQRDMLDYWSEDCCMHMPGVTYKEGRAFAWIQNARGVEGSLVYRGANPDAMINKAIQMVERGAITPRDALMLEEQFGARILDSRTFAIQRPGADRVGSEKETEAMDWTKVIEELRAIDASLADRVTALGEDERPGAMLTMIREVKDQHTAAQRQLTEAEPRARLGDAYMDDLVKQAVAARVRAEGAEAFDGDKYGKLLRGSGDPEFIKSEIKSHELRARVVFGAGERPTTAARTARPPARPYRRA